MATIVGPVQATVTTSTLPAGFCPTTEQDRIDTYAGHTVVSFPTGFSMVTEGNTIPNAADRDKIWFRFDSAGRPDRWYTFADGAWLAEHPLKPNMVMMWIGTQSEIATLDGGTTTPDPDDDTATSGQFWREMTEAIGRVPIHPDPSKTVIKFQTTVPTGGGTADNVSLLSTGGEERHLLTDDELAEHKHKLATQNITYNPGTTSTVQFVTSIASLNNHETGNMTNQASNDKEHNNMPPFIGIYLIKRTRRTHYRID